MKGYDIIECQINSLAMYSLQTLDSHVDPPSRHKTLLVLPCTNCMSFHPIYGHNHILYIQELHKISIKTYTRPKRIHESQSPISNLSTSLPLLNPPQPQTIPIRHMQRKHILTILTNRPRPLATLHCRLPLQGYNTNTMPTK